jgi:hypothetical protein
MAKPKKRTVSRSGKKSARKTRSTAKRPHRSRRAQAGPKLRRAAEGLPSLTKSSVVRKKRPAIKRKERKVDEARRRLMQAETALAAEELPDLTTNH